MICFIGSHIPFFINWDLKGCCFGDLGFILTSVQLKTLLLMAWIVLTLLIMVGVVIKSRSSIFWPFMGRSTICSRQ